MFYNLVIALERGYFHHRYNVVFIFDLRLHLQQEKQWHPSKCDP